MDNEVYSGELRQLPPYPAHLTPAERSAVFEKATRDLHAILLVKPEYATKSASVGILTKMAATLRVENAWLRDRVEALEVTVAQLSAKEARE